MNLCLFAGRFVKKPELKQVGENNVSVVNFSIAVNRQFTSKDGQVKKEATYIDCEAWDTGAQTIAEHCDKGDYIIIYTSAKNESWNDSDGKKRNRMKFRVDRFEFVPGGRAKAEVQPVASVSKDVEDDDNSIPF